MLERVAAEHGPPKYLVTDQGVQFQHDYRAWCRRRGVRPRFGAVGKHGSIALVERFILSLKSEAFADLGMVPEDEPAMRARMAAYRVWFNEHRPHRALGGATPAEVVALAKLRAEARTEDGERQPRADDLGTAVANQAPRFEPRERYPAAAPCAAPRVEVRGGVGARLALVVDRMPGVPHLPIVSLRQAA